VSEIDKGQMIGLEEFIIFSLEEKDRLAITVSTWQLKRLTATTFLNVNYSLPDGIKCWHDFYIHHIYCFVTSLNSCS